MRVQEWDEPGAPYPNLWRGGMPRLVLATDVVASRLRLGDLIAVFHPESTRHPERSGRFVGLSRVTGLRRNDDAKTAWIDLESAWRFAPPLGLDDAPRRPFLCCDPGWPEAEVRLFRRVAEAAILAGWVPTRDEREVEPVSAPPAAPPAAPLAEPAVEPRSPATAPGRRFGGVDYSGDMRDPRERTWLAIVEASEDASLRVVRLEATGRHRLEGMLRDPDTLLRSVEAIGLDFPFALPIPFAEAILGGSFPEDGWWGLARRFEKMARPHYLVAIQEFVESGGGEPKRLTDERADAFSPLHRVNPDLGPMTYHGIRMIAEDRSRYVVRPFERAKGCLLLEVYPGAFLKGLSLPVGEGDEARLHGIVDAAMAASRYPVRIPRPHLDACLKHRDAIDAVLAARAAAIAVLTGEADRSADDLAPGEGERIRREGWIYGIER